MCSRRQLFVIQQSSLCVSVVCLWVRRTLFKEGVFASAPHGAGPASAEAERWLHSWGSQLDLAEGMETGRPLSLSSPARSTARSLGSEARSAVSSPQSAGPVFHLSPSEEEDVESTGYSPTLSPQYEELLEVVTRAVAKLNIDWPADDQTEKQRSKLDERFLRSKSLPLRLSLPFFPDLHTEVSRSWKNPFSSRLFIPASDYYGNVAGLSECGYRTMPRVEQTLAGYLAPDAASSLKAPVLPTKPLRGSSALLGKGYAAAGQAGACLHTMAVLQAYQADLLKELDEGEQISSSDVGELRRTADLALRATKETARAIGRSMAAMVAAERHLWLTLSDMKEKDRVVLMDAPLAPSGLFGDAVNSVVDRFQEASKQAAAFQRFLPRRSIALGAAGREQPQPCTSSSYREIQRQSVASRAPPQRDRGRQRSKKSRPSETKPDLRVVLQSRKPSMKRSWRLRRTVEGGPCWGRAGCTALHGVRLSSAPSGDRSANPARAPGRSGLPRVPLSVLSAVAESLATPSGISRAATSVASCRSSVSGHQSGSSKHTRGQSRETGSLSRLFSSVETTAKCISLGPADCRERLSYSIRRSAATFQRVVSHEYESRAGSGIRTRGQLSSEEGGHRGGPSSRQRVRVLQPVLRCSKEGWGATSNFRSAATEPLSQPPEVQNAYCKTGRVSDQIRGLVHHDRSKRRLFPCIHPSQSQEVPEVRFQGQSLPISGSSLRPSTLTSNFHEVRGCCTGSSATPGHPHTQLHRRLVDFSSFRADGGSTSRCRSRSHERVGVKTKCKEKCAVSIPENHLSRRGVGFDRVTLATDASLTGWGAVMSGHPARGLWSGHNLTWHINCLEMLAVFRALKHFLPDLRNYNVLVRTDNTAVVSYINHQGGLRSRPLCKLAHQILVWSQDKFLSLRAVYIPGHLNVEADILSRQGPRPGEWRLHPEVVKQIWRVLGQAQVDLFATHQISHCPLWYSLTHPAPLGLDAIVQTWPRLRLYAFPPIALLPGVLERVRRDGVRLLLVAPFWPGRVWFSDLISLLDGSPWEIPVRRDLLSQAEGMIFHPRPELWKLWVWHLRGRNS